MNHFIILDLGIKAAFETSKNLEKQLNGDWVYFDTSDGETARGLYRIENDQVKKALDSNFNDLLMEAHDSFLNHFLGLFTPTLESQISMYKAKSFKDFCIKLNKLLISNKKIFDASRSKFWIWHEYHKCKEKNDAPLTIGDKLKKFLEIT